jgi:hypothetical protein
MSDENEYAPYADQWAAEQAYEEFVNEAHPAVQIGDLVFDPAEVLQALDPIAYRNGFNDWLDAQRNA